MVVRTADDSVWTATFNSGGVFNNDWVSIPGGTPSIPALAWDATASELCLVITDVPGLILWRYLINKGNFYFYSHKCSHVYNGIIDFYLTKHLTK